MENNKTHTVDELRLLYSISPAKLRKHLKLNEKIYTDDDGISQLEGMLRNCKVIYELKTHDIPGRKVYEITIGEKQAI
ncbi:hypothetical protein BDD43_2057 [Mucilaginibacter gracilis]|uniref:Uncharacterized protein n=1 Tax=Mucilaginibacter gracilis TaxID=423350 RepID=A0A495IYV8_9SPHI|nr:hypothetical protein [Mucilaginibacter gracilis]RKR81896.1 hypothetical protein BDD43_2057 [Mucilaginibacter gracilis]